MKKICSLIIDRESCCNCYSVRLVEKFNLTVVAHPKSYKLHWIMKGGGHNCEKTGES